MTPATADALFQPPANLLTWLLFALSFHGTRPWRENRRAAA